EGGGGVSLWTYQECEFVNTTFAANQQLAASGLGGGGLYAEDADPGTQFDVFVLNCTFAENSDAAGHGSSIRPNVFNTEVLKTLGRMDEPWPAASLFSAKVQLSTNTSNCVPGSASM